MWFVYILKCSDGTLYTGSTTSLDRRLLEHNETSKGAKYTRSRRPVELVAFCIVKDRSAALRLESKVKSLKKSEKIAYLTKEKSNDLDKTK
jgi:putative endonuclease